MGFVEESGAAQYLRDVRITAIYEGTNGIQSMDLVGRKLMDQGAAAGALLDEISDNVKEMGTDYPDLSAAVWDAVESLRETTEWMITQSDINQRFAGAVPYLKAFARVLGGYYHLSASCNETGNGPRTKLANFYIKNLLPEHVGLLVQAIQGADDLQALDFQALAG
jgi:hypothetical protein